MIILYNHYFFCFTTQCNRSDTPVCLQDILKELQSHVDVDKRSYINIRRGHIWEDACRYLSRKKFESKAIISVKFADDDGSSEGAIDAGGPRREFLRLLIKAANEHSGIFQGKLDERVLFPNASGKADVLYSSKCCIINALTLHWVTVGGKMLNIK